MRERNSQCMNTKPVSKELGTSHCTMIIFHLHSGIYNKNTYFRLWNVFLNVQILNDFYLLIYLLKHVELYEYLN